MKQKQKTNKSAAKRFRLTGTGKVKVKKAYLRHNLGNKSRDYKRNKRKAGYLSQRDVHRAYGCLPYGALR